MYRDGEIAGTLIRLQSRFDLVSCKNEQRIAENWGQRCFAILILRIQGPSIIDHSFSLPLPKSIPSFSPIDIKKTTMIDLSDSLVMRQDKTKLPLYSA